MEPTFAPIALLGVLIGSALVGVYVVLYDANHWPAMADRVRRFVRGGRLDSDEPG